MTRIDQDFQDKSGRMEEGWKGGRVEGWKRILYTFRTSGAADLVISFLLKLNIPGNIINSVVNIPLCMIYF